MDSRNEIMVTVRCLAYNHEPYIRQCLEGFVMQKTNFRFEAIIHDDASTDGTAKIIKEYAEKYPDIIKPIFEEKNQYSKHDGSLTRIMNEHTHGKYIALCEGDDYWTDPLKLQKQVEILEHNHKIGLCYTKASIYVQKDNVFKNCHSKPYKGYKSILISNPIMTLTTLFRKDLYFMYLHEIKPYSKNWLMGDYPLWLYLAAKSEIYFLPEKTAVYRYLENSASHSSDLSKQEKFNQNIIDIKHYFRDLFLPNTDLEKEWNDNFYRRNIRNGLDANNRLYCLKNLIKLPTKTFKDRIKIILFSFNISFNLYQKYHK